MFEVSTRTAQ